jgi:hypothetical protein
MPFVKAQEGPPNIGDQTYTVQYIDEEGNMTIRSRGTRAWRNNNPGNLISNSYTRSKNRNGRTIGKAGGGPKESFAVYPDYESGHRALIDMLGGKTWGKKTLERASKDYTPGDPEHIKNIEKMTGLERNRKINSLNKKEFEAYWKAFETIEKWEVGREDFIPKWVIAGVHKKKGKIFEYLVRKPSGDIWVSKKKALQMTKKGQLHAVLVHLKNGHNYLRPEYHAGPFTLIT